MVVYVDTIMFEQPYSVAPLNNEFKCIQNDTKMCSLKVQFCESTKSIASHVLDE